MPTEDHLPENPDRWVFDQEVTDGFDAMLERSIPQLAVMRAAVSQVAAAHLPPGGLAVDLGCSNGGALAGVAGELDVARHARAGTRLVGVEVSEPMLDAARGRFAAHPPGVRVDVIAHDLRAGPPPGVAGASVVLSVLTLQFTPIEHRLRILRDCWRLLDPGGALVLVEKVLGATAELNELMVDLYHRRKREAGYTDEQIERKRLSLEGALVPVTARMNEELLAASGFGQVDSFWRWMNFAGWVAVR